MSRLVCCVEVKAATAQRNGNTFTVPIQSKLHCYRKNYGSVKAVRKLNKLTCRGGMIPVSCVHHQICFCLTLVSCACTELLSIPQTSRRLRICAVYMGGKGK